MIFRTAAALGALVLATSCSGGDGHNDADVEFATEMIGHHAEAIQMANYTIGRESLDPKVAALAEQIRVTRTEEIDTLSGWLRDWDEVVPETGFATGDGHTHEEQDHGPDQERLADASDADFERLWLEQMSEHHEDAVSLGGRRPGGGRESGTGRSRGCDPHRTAGGDRAHGGAGGLIISTRRFRS